ncbi:MAG: YbhB/YbcL family Raf kinase inhibitor-like protein [Aigarchaeota archaeon]|nr:YbhB/YbcL family Raf kinase inhibitor-like protein [Candidatus Pelearchaeum maunauluense]
MSLIGKRVVIVAFLVLAVAVASSILYLRQPSPERQEIITAGEGFILRSPAFKEGERIPVKFTCDGVDVSPPLEWRGIPRNARSLAIIVEDIDAPAGIFTHWILYNIPANVEKIGENAIPPNAKEGINDFGRTGYTGPCPPSGKPHTYVFRLLALDLEGLAIKKTPNRDTFLNTIKGHIIAEARLTGIYSR